MGEGIGNDEAIMQYITSANIACGYHAGDEDTMRQTIALAKKFNVAIGAHPSFQDRENFGRSEMSLSPSEIYQLVQQQMKILQKIAYEYDMGIDHIKPHGALYNMAARNKEIAKAIAQAVYDYNKNLVLFGLSGSLSLKEAIALGLTVKSEVFADRTYQDDGSLTPRSQPGAMIEDDEKALQQALQMVKTGTVRSLSGNEVKITADTICIHGDGPHALAFVKKIYHALSI
jgi:UPF0271 protein